MLTPSYKELQFMADLDPLRWTQEHALFVAVRMAKALFGDVGSALMLTTNEQSATEAEPPRKMRLISMLVKTTLDGGPSKAQK